MRISCESCGKTVKPKWRPYGKPKFCDMDCYLSARQVSVIKRCLQCKKPYRATRTLAHLRKYCSIACDRERRRKYPKTIPCAWCERPVAQTRNRRKKFCSKTCRDGKWR